MVVFVPFLVAFCGGIKKGCQVFRTRQAMLIDKLTNRHTTKHRHRHRDKKQTTILNQLLDQKINRNIVVDRQ